ncbi:MAG: DNA mismatch endonuclease Vsr [Nitrospirae bacterium]|nr:DNA mismatch endonuclease Vsr [Nitrospirota bacterium]
MDVHSPEKRSYNMSRIKWKDTLPEKLVRKLLWRSGYRYRLHRKDLPGKPDIVFPGRKKVVFIHGCFWHKHDCKYFKWPSSNVEFWRQKIENNVNRDQMNTIALVKAGWKYLVVWECEVRNMHYSELIERIKVFLESQSGV